MGLGKEALFRRGVPPAQIAQSHFVAANGRTATLLVKARPFEPQELQVLRTESARNGLGCFVFAGRTAAVPLLGTS